MILVINNELKLHFWLQLWVSQYDICFIKDDEVYVSVNPSDEFYVQKHQVIIEQ